MSSDRFPQPAQGLGVSMITAERERQVTGEFFSEHHDDALKPGTLADAAGCYALLATVQLQLHPSMAWEMAPPNEPPLAWPLAAEWWKPSHNPLRNLAKAGALIAAEMDRLHRLS
jgi:hypothetical protein